MPNTSTVLGNAAITIPSDTTANRPGDVGSIYSATAAVAGMLRFNTTTANMEYYDGTGWQAIAAPPFLSSISPTSWASTGDTITLTGSFFGTGATVSFISKTGAVYNAASSTYVSGSSYTGTIPSGMSSDKDDPYDVKITNSSGLAYTLAACLSRSSAITFNTASGSIGTIRDSGRGSYSLSSVTATAAESDLTLTYSITSGSLPSGMSLSSGGTISGTPSQVGSNTTSTFTVTATGTDASNSSNTQTASRSFSITINAPVISTYTSGSGTFSVPAGVTTVDVLVVAGGGGGGNQHAGGGGAGGLIYRPAYPVSPGGSVPYSIGGGGSGGNSNVGSPGPSGNAGGNSVFGALTAIAGGGGGNGFGYSSGQAGGSGGGPNGGGQQPGQPGESGSYGFGNPGGSPSNQTGAGGGGAGGSGNNASGGQGGPGGIGRAYSISGSSTYYAGGGGAGGHNSTGGQRFPGGQGGGGSGGGYVNQAGQDYGEAGQGNRGGGGGGSGGQNSASGSGGSGVVIVSY